MTDVNAAEALKRARAGRGLTQSALAALADTSQSAIAAYETGRRQPTLPVLRRMVRAAGYEIGLELRPDPSVFDLADVARSIRGTNEEPRSLRLVFEFLRSADEDGHALPLLVAAEPPPTGEPRFDALLAAVAEHLCVHADIPPPAWVYGKARFLDGFGGLVTCHRHGPKPWCIPRPRFAVGV